jgi:uncharacterized protein (UPF0332 family)
MNYSREDLIKYRLTRANESLEEAKILSHSKHWNTVANRLYYAAFYSVNALLVQFEIQGTTHSGVKSIFHKEFIKTGMLDKEYGRLYSNLFNKRQEGDYQDFQFFEKETIEPLIIKVEEFISQIEILINSEFK